ncbi:MAG: 30S ribosomal protein S16 [Bacteroidales bacterium]|nr:30S ribosomal protein S16 [Bacteroidales bacterium]
MATKMRLQRRGRKGRPFYHIVIADGRAPRDGKFIEKIGSYNPITNPAEIVLDFDKALSWLQKGAQPTDTVNAILRFKGVLLKNHLQKGILKGALTQEQADAKFNAWVKERETRNASQKSNLEQKQRDARKSALDAEKKVSEARLAKIQERKMAEMKALEDAAKAAAEAAAAAQAETAAEAPAEEATETPAAE